MKFPSYLHHMSLMVDCTFPDHHSQNFCENAKYEDKLCVRKSQQDEDEQSVHEDVSCEVLTEKEGRKTRMGRGCGGAEAFVLGLHNTDSCRPETGGGGGGADKMKEEHYKWRQT